MREIEHIVEIDAPPETVWAVVSDVGADGGWNPFMTSALDTPTGVLSTTEKNTFKSNATASSVLGRTRKVRNCRYSSASGWPTLN